MKEGMQNKASETQKDGLRAVLIGILRLVSFEFHSDWCSEIKEHVEKQLDIFFKDCIKAKTELYKLTHESEGHDDTSTKKMLSMIKKSKNKDVKHHLMSEYLSGEIISKKSVSKKQIPILKEFSDELLTPAYPILVTYLYDAFKKEGENADFSGVSDIFRNESCFKALSPEDQIKILVMKGEPDLELAKFMKKLPKMIGNLGCFRIFAEHMLRNITEKDFEVKKSALKSNLTVCFAFPLKNELAIHIRTILEQKEKGLRRKLLELMVSLGTICPHSLVADNIEENQREIPWMETEKSLRKALSIYPKSLPLWKNLLQGLKKHSPGANIAATFQQ